MVLIQEPGAPALSTSGSPLQLIQHEAFFLDDGVPAPDAIEPRLARAMAAARDRGASNLRLLLAMDWIAHDRALLLQIEAAITEACRRHGCITICRFEHRSRNSENLECALAAHSKLLVGSAVHENLLHIPALDQLGGAIGGSRLDRQLSALARAGEISQEHQRDRTFLSAVLDTVRALVVVVDRKGRVVRFNRACAQATGYSEDEMLGRPIWERLILPADVEALQDHVRQMKRGAEPEQLTSHWVARDGRRLVVAWSSMPLEDEAGRLTHILGTGIDVTAQRAAERSLVKSERRYRRLLDALQEGVWVLDQDGRTTFVNPRMARMVGYSVEEMLGRHLFEFVDDGGLARAKRSLDRRRQGIREEFDFSFVRKDGRSINTLVAMAPVRSDSGEYRGAVSGVVDITDQRAAEDALRWEAAVNATMAALSSLLISPSSIEDISTLVLDHAKRITDSPIGYVGHVDPHTGELVCPTLLQDIEDGACAVPHGETVFDDHMGLWNWVSSAHETVLVNDMAADPRSGSAPEGHPRIKRFLCSPALLGDELVGQLALANARREYQERDRVLLDRLSVLFALAVERQRREEALLDQAEELRAQNHDLDTFARTVAHDLRSPLTAILSAAQLMDKPTVASDEEQRARISGLMQRNVNRMDRIISELLLLARVRKEAVKPRQVDMDAVVAEVLDRMRLSIEATGARISLPERWPAALGHAPWVEEVWANYLDNALKHTGPDPFITLGADPAADGQVRFWVKDRGPGLAPDQQERIFEAFEVTAPTPVRGSHGLGLNIVSTIIYKLDGEVGVESQLGAGSTFFFTLPALP